MLAAGGPMVLTDRPAFGCLRFSCTLGGRPAYDAGSRYRADMDFILRRRIWHE